MGRRPRGGRGGESFLPKLLDFVFTGLISYLCHEYYGAVRASRLRSITKSGESAFAFETIVCPVTMGGRVNSVDFSAIPDVILESIRRALGVT